MKRTDKGWGYTERPSGESASTQGSGNAHCFYPTGKQQTPEPAPAPEIPHPTDEERATQRALEQQQARTMSALLRERFPTVFNPVQPLLLKTGINKASGRRWRRSLRARPCSCAKP